MAHDDEESRAETSADETAAMSTANAPADTSAPTQPSAPLEGERYGLETTSDTGEREPGENAETTDSPKPSRDPADAMGDNECRPDASTEPPDMPEGTRGQGSREQVETRRLRALTEGGMGTGDSSIKAC